MRPTAARPPVFPRHAGRVRRVRDEKGVYALPPAQPADSWENMIKFLYRQKQRFFLLALETSSANRHSHIRLSLRGHRVVAVLAGMSHPGRIFYGRRLTESKQLYLVASVGQSLSRITHSINFPSCLRRWYGRLLAW
jgi:hypothetical protein